MTTPTRHETSDEELQLLKKISSDPDRSFSLLSDLYHRLQQVDSKSASEAIDVARAVVDGTRQRNHKLIVGEPWDLIIHDDARKQQKCIGYATFYSDDEGNICLEDIWIDDRGPYGYFVHSKSPDHLPTLTFSVQHKFYGEIVDGLFSVTVPADGDGPPTAEYLPQIGMEDFEAGLASLYRDIVLVRESANEG